MFDVLPKVLKSAEGVYPPVFPFDDVVGWPEGELDRCLAAGLLRSSKPATHVTCFECGETEEVVVIEDSVTKKSHAYLRCAAVGPVQISPARLQQWEMTYEQLMDVVFAHVKLSGCREEIVRDRVWQLGKTRWGGASRNVYFARGLHWQDAWQVLNRVKLTTRSVVFVPARLPDQDPRIETLPIVIPLTTAVGWEGRTIRFDDELVEAEITEAAGRLDNGSKARSRPAPRGARLALIEALTREMQEHLRAARDHALDTLERTGTPQLLPRPTKELLARKLGVHKSAVTRAFPDKEAGGLRRLWDLAADLDEILRLAGCQV